METSIQLLMYIIAFLIQQAKTNRVGFEGVRVKAMTHKDMILIRLENVPSSVLVCQYTTQYTKILEFWSTEVREINFALKLPFAMQC